MIEGLDQAGSFDTFTEEISSPISEFIDSRLEKVQEVQLNYCGTYIEISSEITSLRNSLQFPLR